MNEQNTPSQDPQAPNPQVPNPPPSTPRDTTGWAQPPAPGGPPGAFVDRQPIPATPLPPGAGSPMQPGPPLSVSAPIRDTTINWTIVAVLAIGALLVLILIAVIGSAIGHAVGGGR